MGRGQELLVSGVLLDCQEHFLGGTMIIERLIIITVDCIFFSGFLQVFFSGIPPMVIRSMKNGNFGYSTHNPQLIGLPKL